MSTIEKTTKAQTAYEAVVQYLNDHPEEQRVTTVAKIVAEQIGSTAGAVAQSYYKLKRSNDGGPSRPPRRRSNVRRPVSDEFVPSPIPTHELTATIDTALAAHVTGTQEIRKLLGQLAKNLNARDNALEARENEVNSAQMRIASVEQALAALNVA